MGKRLLQISRVMPVSLHFLFGSLVLYSYYILISDSFEISLSGADGNDAKPYQEQDVRGFLKKIKEIQR